MRDRPAAADEDAALSFRQGKERRLIGDPHMAGGRQLEAAADAGAAQGRHPRDRSARDEIERPVPVSAALARGTRLNPFRRLGEVQTRREMVSVAEHDAGLSLLAGTEAGFTDLTQQLVVDRVALGRALETDDPMSPSRS